MSSARKRAVVGLTLAVAATGFYAQPGSANPAGTGLVISEVYGAGGNAGATHNADFVELYNPTDVAIDLSGTSIHYRSATGSSGGSPFALTGSVPAHATWLVQMSNAGATGAVLPKPNDTASPAFQMAAAGGQVFLLNGTTAITAAGNMAGNPSIVDMVGLGAATSFETAAGPTATATQSAQRNATGADSDSNAADLKLAAPTPQASTVTPEPPAETVRVTIAEIQGTDAATSPYAGKSVVTRGVVTAAYPTGGYNGFYLQTPGTGDSSDETPGASDAVFVFGSAATEKVAVGDHVEVRGPVTEFAGTTEITPDASDVTVVTEPAAQPTPLATTLPATDAAKEAHEGELLAPRGPFTVTNSYATNQYGEIGLAAGTTPLIAPTEIADAQATARIAEIAADNAARAITLDDGASANYTGTAKDTPMPWLSKTNPVRVGAPVTFTAPVVLEFRNNLWKFQPTSQVVDEGRGTATFVNTRTAAPEQVGGDLRLATFNVLNYFPTTGEEFVTAGLGTCTYYTDRQQNRITVNSCNPNGPRGAANEANLARQQAKTVAAINRLGADIVSLEELENSVKFGKDRDFAIGRLVEALNAAAGAGTWAFAPSPAAADRPAPADEDVIRTGFIYKPAHVELVGASEILIDEVNFDNAREPLAQAFKAVGAPDAGTFAVVVNHFKSKGSGADDGTGQGNANPDRIGQAKALDSFADAFAAERGTDRVFLAGDFNAYSMEDPMQVLYEAGYTAVDSDTEGEETYSFSGLVGSLDHVLASGPALEMVTGADVWNINSVESVGYEYSRYNNNLTNLYEADPFKASDHDPEIVGLDTTVEAAIEQVQILGTNDFHGRLQNNSSGTEAGAAVLAGAVKQLRAANPSTVFAAAGDLIGASTFESFIQKDKPTIDALNEAGLDVSAVGNHEFDAGYDDLINRVMAPYDASTNPYGGAEWEYIGANVHKPGAPASQLLEPTYVKDFGDVEVGFVGAVTEHLHELVSPAGIEGVQIEDIVTATNREANALKAAGVEVVVLLVHEGASSTSLAAATDPASDFGDVVNGVNPNVDAIVSGHTHLAYNHGVPVPEWAAQGRAVTTRPVVSAGQYGSNLNQLLFQVDAASGQVVGLEQNILALKSGQTAGYPADATTKAIVDDAVAQAAVLGARPLGDLAGPFNRAKIATGGENRGGESTAGNLVAEVQRWATRSATTGSAQIAFMNPGGLRADMVGNPGGYPATLTYRQAAEMQPFANTLVNMRLTGAQIRSALEQQWQPAGATRPFLRLGVSKGFTYTYDPTAATGSRIRDMWLDGKAIDPAASYSVTANSFLAAGGDNFTAFGSGTQKRDTGKTDLEAMVDYMAAFASTQPLAADRAQRAVGVSFPTGAPATYVPGGAVAFDLSSLAYSTAADVKDTEISVSLGGARLGTFPVDNTIGTAATDEYGKAAVKVVLPTSTPVGQAVLTVTGLTTGTSVAVPVQVAQAVSTTTATASPTSVKVKKGTTTVAVDVVATNGVVPTGRVEILEGNKLLGSGTLRDGKVAVTVGPFSTVGRKTLVVRYVGDGSVAGSATTTTVTVVNSVPK